MSYCKIRNFRDNFIFANSVKTHICDVRFSGQERDLPLSVNERVISPICEGFIFMKRSFTKINPSRKFPKLQYMAKSLALP